MPGKKVIAAVFASGNGSNAGNILTWAQSNPDRLSIPLVICNKEGAGVIARAEKLGVPCHVVPVVRDGFASYDEARNAQERKVIGLLEKHGVQWALLAGYMQILSHPLLYYFYDKGLSHNRIVNIHPSLLPAFPGKDGYGDAWKAGVKQSGVTLHYVDGGIDTGPVIAQKTFDRLDNDTLDDFRARGMKLEYQIYNEFLESFTS